MMSSFQDQLSYYQHRIESKLATSLPTDSPSQTCLSEAMRYASLNGGKRFRALLVYCCGEACGVTDKTALDVAACAVELIHAYSLIHDDLPAMDNSSLRRGKPTCHLAFGEASAILAGDALQALGFELLANQISILSPNKCLQMVIELAKACGTSGMAGGQALDLLSGQANLDLPQLIHLHRLKTGALIECSARIGALYAAELPNEKLVAIDNYAKHLGLAFQIKDDMLDYAGDATLLGKPVGLDIANKKTTFVSLLSYSGAQTFLAKEIEQAIHALQGASLIDKTLIDLAHFVMNRKN